MTIPVFKKIGTDDLILDKFQTNVDQVLTSISSRRIIDGILLRDIVLTTSALLVPHLLGHPIDGYIVVKSNANAVVYDDEATNTIKDRFIKLLASATVTVTLWVF